VRVDRLIGEYRAGGLAVVGPEEVRRALELGQADELLISASLDRAGSAAEQAAADFVAPARRAGTRVTFIEDPKLLAEVEGVGAFLRYKPAPAPETAYRARARYFLAGAFAFGGSTIFTSNLRLPSMKKTHSEALSQPVVWR